MAITAATRTQFIGLSVAMLGQAPGTDALNLQLDANDGDMGGKWVIENGEGSDDDETVPQEYVLRNDNYDSSAETGPNSMKYWITENGESDGTAVTSDTTAPTGTVLEKAVDKPDGREDKTDDWVTDSIEMITVSGDAGLTVNASAQGDLTTVDLSGSTGKNSITLNGTNKLTSVMGGSGSDTITLKTGNLAPSGLMVDPGAGNDRFVTGVAKSLSAIAANSMINGGDGSDTLAMADGANSTDHAYSEDGETKTIYTGFEVLDVGGGSGEYDLAILGIETLQVSKGTAANGDTVTLKNVAAGTAINASGNSSFGAKKTEAKIDYNLAAREAGSFVFGSDGVLDVNLRAIGRFNDRTDNPSTRYPLKNSLPGIFHYRKTKAWFCFAPEFNSLRYRIRRHIPVPQGSSDLIRASLERTSWGFCYFALMKIEVVPEILRLRCASRRMTAVGVPHWQPSPNEKISRSSKTTGVLCACRIWAFWPCRRYGPLISVRTAHFR